MCFQGQKKEEKINKYDLYDILNVKIIGVYIDFLLSD